MSLITATLDRFAAPERRTMAVACGAHVLHDGFTDLLYVLLPLWQAEFGLGYAAVGLLRALYVGSMAGFQLPAGIIAERFGGPLILGLGTALAGIGYLAAGASVGFGMLAGALILGGLGSGVQHPIGANLVSLTHSGQRSRTALARYNFSGDLGKMAFPAATAGLITLMPWRAATMAIGAVGLLAALAILAVQGLPGYRATSKATAGNPQIAAAPPSGHGFWLLLAIAMIDSAKRMGFLTFLPFLLKMKGADLPAIGIALTLIFTGGAAGKLVCGWLGARLGVVRATFVTEGLTAAGILLLLPLPLTAGLAVLPLIGMALNGTSSVLYGTVPELVPARKRQRAFSIFYTGGVGAGALAPVLYGLASDLADVPTMMMLVAAVVLATLPLAWRLGSYLRQPAASGC
jgi:MFS transporter, FSR family, fosmidomycin resistance protein